MCVPNIYKKRKTYVFPAKRRLTNQDGKAVIWNCGIFVYKKNTVLQGWDFCVHCGAT